MLSPRGQSFTRIWQHHTKEEHSGHPLRLVTYRVALEELASFAHYRHVHYNALSAQHIGLLSTDNNSLSLILKRDTRLCSECLPVIAFFEANRFHHGVFVATVALAYCCVLAGDNHTPRNIDFPFRGRLKPWIREVHIRNYNNSPTGEFKIYIGFNSTGISRLLKALEILDDDEDFSICRTNPNVSSD